MHRFDAIRTTHHCIAGLDRPGLIGIWAQLCCLVGAVLPAFTPAGWPFHAGRGHARLLLAGLVLSRWGLWTFDLAVTQMLQERVASSQLGQASSSSRVCHRASYDQNTVHAFSVLCMR